MPHGETASPIPVQTLHVCGLPLLPLLRPFCLNISTLSIVYILGKQGSPDGSIFCKGLTGPGRRRRNQLVYFGSVNAQRFFRHFSAPCALPGAEGAKRCRPGPAVPEILVEGVLSRALSLSLCVRSPRTRQGQVPAQRRVSHVSGHNAHGFQVQGRDDLLMQRQCSVPL